MMPLSIKIQLPHKTGAITLLWEKDHLQVMKGSKELITINENQGRILKELSEASEGMIATELGQRLGMTHAGALFLLKPLIKAGLVERVLLKGGGVLYYAPIEIRTKLSPNLESAKKDIENKTGKQIHELEVKELYEVTKEYTADVKRALFNWVIEGGWMR